MTQIKGSVNFKNNLQNNIHIRGEARQGVAWRGTERNGSSGLIFKS